MSGGKLSAKVRLMSHDEVDLSLLTNPSHLDALSLKTGSGPFTVIGGGAQGAEDKVIQHNSEGTVNIQGFTAYNFGKLYRSCGNCDDMYERHVTISGVTAVEGSVLAGINSNFGDTAVIKSDVCATGVDTICQEYEGNETGEEVCRQPPRSNAGDAAFSRGID